MQTKQNTATTCEECHRQLTADTKKRTHNPKNGQKCYTRAWCNSCFVAIQDRVAATAKYVRYGNQEPVDLTDETTYFERDDV